MNIRYRIKYNIGDSSYIVWNNKDEKEEFKGSIQDCEAWLKLNDAGYIY